MVLQYLALQLLRGLELAALYHKRLRLLRLPEGDAGDERAGFGDFPDDAEVRVVVAQVRDVLAVEGEGGTQFLGGAVGLKFEFGEAGQQDLVLERGGEQVLRDLAELGQFVGEGESGLAHGDYYMWLLYGRKWISSFDYLVDHLLQLVDLLQFRPQQGLPLLLQRLLLLQDGHQLLVLGQQVVLHADQLLDRGEVLANGHLQRLLLLVGVDFVPVPLHLLALHQLLYLDAQALGLRTALLGVALLLLQRFLELAALLLLALGLLLQGCELVFEAVGLALDLLLPAGQQTAQAEHFLLQLRVLLLQAVVCALDVREARRPCLQVPFQFFRLPLLAPQVMVVFLN